MQLPNTPPIFPKSLPVLNLFASAELHGITTLGTVSFVIYLAPFVAFFDRGHRGSLSLRDHASLCPFYPRGGVCIGTLMITQLQTRCLCFPIQLLRLSSNVRRCSEGLGLGFGRDSTCDVPSCYLHSNHELHGGSDWLEWSEHNRLNIPVQSIPLYLAARHLFVTVTD